jgi:hypothetical protein
VTKKVALHKLIFDLDIEDYHRGTVGYSSSQFKDLLDDEDVFIAKNIEKRIEREESPAFDVGTYFHTGILEPHKLKEDCIVFPGKIRRGAKWEAFKKKHARKAIVSQSQKDQALGLIKAVKSSKVAKKYLGGKPEVSLFTEIAVCSGWIYAPYFGKRLTRDGWIADIQGAHSARKHGFPFVVKVRADTLGKMYISDLKSTSSNARSMVDMKKTVSNYHYDLSAALYMDMFSLLRPELKKFIWIFASKSVLHSKTWRASEDNILIGRAKYMKAMVSLAKCARNAWKLEDELGILEPAHWDREWLVENEIDLL